MVKVAKLFNIPPAWKDKIVVTELDIKEPDKKR
jgi:hypothetical protein